MASAKSSKKSTSSTPGVKALITATSLVATLGGWAVLSAQETKSTPTPMPEQTAAPVIAIELAPLPTLVPPFTPAPSRNTSRPVRPAAVSAPPAVTTNQIILRDVSAPALPDRSAAPAPVTTTHSSR